MGKSAKNTASTTKEHNTERKNKQMEDTGEKNNRE